MTDEVPPLEDVPDVLERIKQTTMKAEKQERRMSGSEVTKAREDSRGDSSGNAEKTEIIEKKPRLMPQKKQQSSAGFCGMKRGFLFSAPAKTKKSTGSRNEADLPMIKAKPQVSKFVIKEVQEAMDAGHAMDFQDQLAKRLETSDRVRDVLSDPAWIPILDEFQRDPQAAMVKYRDNKEISNTLKEMCSVLGDTFLSMSTKVPSEEELQSNPHTQDPEVLEALQDPLVQKMMTHMKEGANDRVQWCVQSANPTQKKRIKTLIDAGFFKFSI